MVLRGGRVAFHSPQQQHGFNFPYQMGSPDSMSDNPSAAQVRAGGRLGVVCCVRLCVHVHLRVSVCVLCVWGGGRERGGGTSVPMCLGGGGAAV